MPFRFGCILLLTVNGWLALAAIAYAQSDLVRFEQDVLPILSRHCLDCHGADEHQSALRLDTMTSALRGGDSGETVIAPGASSRSHLIERVTSTSKQLRMPPDGQEPLSDQEIQLLKRWIDDAESWRSLEMLWPIKLMSTGPFSPSFGRLCQPAHRLIRSMPLPNRV